MNENIFMYINNCLNEDVLPHAFLVESSNVNQATEEIINFLHQKKILKNNNPVNNLNLIIIKSDGKEIKSAEINNLKSRFAMMPSNDKYNVYIIIEAEKMNASSANKILKFLEEPNDFTLGFLVINRDSSVLETIKSRCQLFRLESKDQSESLSNHAIEIINFFDNPDYEKELELRNILSNLERSDIITIIDSSLSILSNKLPKDTQFTITITSNMLLLDNILRLLKSNVNIDLVLDKLFIEAR